jgi:hypothetical protein
MAKNGYYERMGDPMKNYSGNIIFYQLKYDCVFVILFLRLFPHLMKVANYCYLG